MKRRPIWPSAGLLYLLFVNAQRGPLGHDRAKQLLRRLPRRRAQLAHARPLDGPFNEHLIRDVGAPSLGLAVVVAAALGHCHARSWSPAG
ncbi:MAG: hypothetical protein WKF58_07070 [Ilumatobacteraceae bacterium]